MTKTKERSGYVCVRVVTAGCYGIYRCKARIQEERGAVIKDEFNIVGIAQTETHDIFAYNDVC